MSGQHAASGYKVILEILARPALLVFGLIVSMVIMTPFMQFFSTAYFNALNTTTADTLFGIVTFVFTVILYGAMCWMVVNMILHAITAVPNGIMRVIGGMEGTNMRSGQEMAQNVKGGAMIAMNKTVDAVQHGKGAAHQASERKFQDSMMNKGLGDAKDDKGGDAGAGGKKGKDFS